MIGKRMDKLAGREVHGNYSIEEAEEKTLVVVMAHTVQQPRAIVVHTQYIAR